MNIKKILINAALASAISLPVYAMNHEQAASDASNAMSNANNAAGSQCNCKMGGKMAQQWRNQMDQKLNLSQDQKDKIQAIRDKYHPLFKNAMQQRMMMRQQMMQMTMQPTLDEQKLDTLLQHRSEMSSKMTKMRIQMKRDIYQVLNDDQKSMMKNMMMKGQSMMMDRMNQDKSMDDSNQQQSMVSDMMSQ